MPDAKRCRLECIIRTNAVNIFYIEGQWLYLYGIYQKGMLRLPVKYLKQRKKYSFRNNELLVDYVGNRIVGMSSEGKRLCFFKEVNK